MSDVVDPANPAVDPTEVSRHPWAELHSTYREEEIQILLQWISTGASGSIIGLNGSGKSNLIGFLCHRTDIVQRHLPHNAQRVTVLPMDLNSLPDNTLSALFRVILRTFYEYQHRFNDDTKWLISHLYIANRAATDPFLSQSALRELLLYLQQRRHRVVFVLDRFDLFCNMVSAEMGDALRALRDSFKDTLSYIASMRLGLSYLPEPEILGDLHRLLDQRICYVGPLNQRDTRETILQRLEFAPEVPTMEEIDEIWQLSGGYPSLVTVICQWWQSLAVKPPLPDWEQLLLTQTNIRDRLDDIWVGLTQEEQMVMAEVQRTNMIDDGAQHTVGQRYGQLLTYLAERKLCLYQAGHWRIFSDLFAAHVAEVGDRSQGKITYEAATKTLYHGGQPFTDLTPKEAALLQFMVEQPYVRHSYTDLIVAVWDDDERYHGVANDSLYQLVRTLRVKIEPNASNPVFIVNWRGRPEGGYLFYPEGRPQLKATNK